jgi:hypothetical protein
MQAGGGVTSQVRVCAQHGASWRSTHQPHHAHAHQSLPLQAWCAVNSSPCGPTGRQPGSGSDASPPPRMRLSPAMPRFLPSAGLLATGAQGFGLDHPNFGVFNLVLVRHGAQQCRWMI